MRFFKYLFIALAFSFLYSCDNATEEIYLNADGSGEYKVYSNMIPSMVQMMGVFMAMDTSFQGTTAEMEEVITARIWEDFPAEVDSISGPKDSDLAKFKDSPRKLELANRMNNIMFGSKEKGYMNAGMKFKFSNIAELNEYMVIMNDQAENGGDGPGLSVNADYGLKKKCLKRICTYSQNEEVNPEQIAQMEEMFGNGKAKTIIHLPKNVKSVEGNGMIKKTDKMVVFEYDMIEMVKGNVDTNFEIKWRK